MSMIENLLPKYRPLDRSRRDNLCDKTKYLQLTDFYGKQPEPFSSYCDFQKQTWPNLYSSASESEMKAKYESWTEVFKNLVGFHDE